MSWKRKTAFAKAGPSERCSGGLRRSRCPGTELNRYPRFGGQDFKSCVSTNSTTGAYQLRITDYGLRIVESTNKKFHPRR